MDSRIGRGWWLGYAVAAAASTVSGQRPRGALHQRVKPFVVPVLGLALATADRRRPVPGTGRLIASIGAAGVGDRLMARRALAPSPAAQERLLHLGAGGFAVQHLGYLSLLLPHWQPGRRTNRAVAAHLAWLSGLALFVGRKEGRFDPMLASYGALLAGTSTAATAARAPRGVHRRLRLGGAMFVLSDSLIVAGPHLTEDDSRARAVTEAAILVTYYLAQGLLIDGMDRLNEEPPPPAPAH